MRTGSAVFRVIAKTPAQRVRTNSSNEHYFGLDPELPLSGRGIGQGVGLPEMHSPLVVEQRIHLRHPGPQAL